MSLILITGGAGFIGQHLSRKLLSQGHSIRVIDNFNSQVHSTTKLPTDLAEDIDLVRDDIRNVAALKKALTGVNRIVHLAAETGTGQSMYEIDKYFSVNVQGTALMLDLLANTNLGDHLENIVVASSRAIYGEGAYFCVNHQEVYPKQRTLERMSAGSYQPSCPYCEGALDLIATKEISPLSPSSFYGLTKQIQEQAVLMFAGIKGINAYALRYQNVYGPGQSLTNPYTGILAIFSNLARQNQMIEIYEDGLESRDFVYIDDVVKVTAEAVNSYNLYQGSLNVGSGVPTSVVNVAELIKKFFNSESEIKTTGKYRMGDIRHNIADTAALQKLFGFKPGVEFEEGLASFLSWALKEEVADSSAYSKSLNELSARGLFGYESHN